MNTKNIVFIATSIDGYIADQNGGIEWLHSIPNPDNVDMGYLELMQEVEAIVMGRTTFETVLGFGVEWPYQKPVFVLSNTLTEVPKKLKGKIEILNGSLTTILATIHQKGFFNLYIDGGSTVQGFLKEDLIDELRISTIPLVLGGGFPLFGELVKPLKFELTKSKTYVNQIVQSHFVRKR